MNRVAEIHIQVSLLQVLVHNQVTTMPCSAVSGDLSSLMPDGSVTAED